ncbi:MAG: transketolase [Thermodesulfobacteriota bacterium]
MKKQAISPFGAIDELCINTLRFLAVDAVEKAQSGHPGMPMGDAPMAHVLWTRFLRHNPAGPLWPDRDRFVLSAGHGSMLLYSLLHLVGYGISLEDLKHFRQFGSKTPGHPEYNPALGIETTTGPLGQGFANGVGMAIAQRYMADRYNRPGHELFDYRVFAITSDGDLMEGVSNEAASLAGHLGLGNLVYLYSDNKITIEGSTDLAFTEDVGGRFTALGWHVQKVGGLDLDGIAASIASAVEEKTRPSLIIARTNIGFGSPGKQDTADVHGAPLGADEVRVTKERLGWPLEPDFYVPPEALAEYRKSLAEGRTLEEEWKGRLAAYAEEFPELHGELTALLDGRRDTGWQGSVPSFSASDGPMATRSASGKVLNAVAPKAPFLIGGSADLAPSNNTALKDLPSFTPEHAGRNLHFGVREHAMGSVMNGMALSGTLVPYGGTFLIFSDYMRPPVRLAALMGLQTVYVFTHDSIGLGEDGPTHQPIEQLAALRAVPNLTVIRPADAGETAVAWRVALTHESGPVALALTRQKVPVLDRTRYAPAEGVARGAYVLVDPDEGEPEVILIATGSEVHIALDAFDELAARGVRARVVSMPSWELFDAQDAGYRDSVLPPATRLRIAVEAGCTQGWHRYVGDLGEVVGVDHFGASAPYKVIYEKFGVTAEVVASRALEIINRSKGLLLDGL